MATEQPLGGNLRRRAVLLLAAIALPALVPAVETPSPPSPGGELLSLTILHTSDLHGSVLPFDDTRNRPADGSLAQLATLVERIRAQAGRTVLLLDSGDTIQGTPLEQFVHVRWNEPSPTIAAMNLMGYQAMAIGNHEFNFGLEVLRKASQEARFPFLSANVVKSGTTTPAFRPYTILEAGPLRIGVLGLTTPRVPGWEMPENYRGLEFLPMDEAARRWVPVLREREGCGLVIVLAHTGFERDLETGEPTGTAAEDFAWRLTRVPGIDLLLTGHTHRNIPPRRLNGVIVSQPSARARRLTRIDLELARKTGGWTVTSFKGANLSAGGVEPDPAVVRLVEPAHRRVVAALDGPVGRVTAPVSVRGCRLGDCAALDLVHAVQLEASGADLSLASLLTDRTPDLPAGPVSWRWVYALYVYPNTLVAVRLTGRQVVDVLEHAARYYDGLDCTGSGGCTVLTDPAVRHYNVDTVAGLSYRVDPLAPEGNRIRDVRFRGLPMDPGARFTLVCNNYRAAGGGGFPHLASAEIVWRSSTEMTDLIGEWLTRHEPWNPVVDGNWWIAPSLVGERPLPTPAGMNRVAP